MDVRPVPPPRAKVNWLILIGALASLATLPLFGALGGAWVQFDGDWNGPLDLVNGRSGRVWFVIAHAWTYLVPLILGLALAAATAFGCFLAAVLRDGRQSRGSRP